MAGRERKKDSQPRPRIAARRDLLVATIDISLARRRVLPRCAEAFQLTIGSRPIPMARGRSVVEDAIGRVTCDPD